MGKRRRRENYGKYSEKSQLTAFLLSLFIGPITGAGRFYVGDYAEGIIKLLLPIVLICACGIVAFCTGNQVFRAWITQDANSDPVAANNLELEEKVVCIVHCLPHLSWLDCRLRVVDSGFCIVCRQ